MDIKLIITAKHIDTVGHVHLMAKRKTDYVYVVVNGYTYRVNPKHLKECHGVGPYAKQA